jgi:hypothetical protein
MALGKTGAFRIVTNLKPCGDGMNAHRNLPLPRNRHEPLRAGMAAGAALQARRACLAQGQRQHAAASPAQVGQKSKAYFCLSRVLFAVMCS